jgi:hypothetical protein
MKTLAKLLTVLAIAALGQSAYGISYMFQEVAPGNFVDQEYWNLQGATGLDVDPTISGTLSVASSLPGGVEHLYDNFGYDKNLHNVTAIEILFALNTDVIEIKFGDVVASGGSTGLDAAGDFVGGGAIIHEFDFVSGFSGTLLVDLVDTGVLNWTVSLNQDQVNSQVDVNLLAASLAMKTRPVPDSASTLGLLGLGLFGLVGLKRRLS